MSLYSVTQRVKDITGTRKKAFDLTTSTKFNISTGWSGGTKSYYNLLNFKSGKEIPLDYSKVGDQFYKQSSDQELALDSILIETGVFCGKPAIPRILCRPEQEAEVKEWLEVKE